MTGDSCDSYTALKRFPFKILHSGIQFAFAFAQDSNKVTISEKLMLSEIHENLLYNHFSHTSNG